MTERTVLVVKTSWSFLVPHADEAGALFYQTLFDLDPSLRALFKPDLRHQAKKLTDMLTFIVSKLQTLADLETQIAGLARRHGRYGVRPEHYQTVGQALLLTLQAGLTDRWNDETRQAWTEVYSLLASAMLAATDKTSLIEEQQ